MDLCQKATGTCLKGLLVDNFGMIWASKIIMSWIDFETVIKKKRIYEAILIQKFFLKLFTEENQVINV